MQNEQNSQPAAQMTDERIDGLPVYAYEVTTKNGNSDFAYAAWFHKYGNPFKETSTYEPMVRLADVRALLSQAQVAQPQEPVELDFSKPLETFNGEPVEHVGNCVIEYKCARVCVNPATGVVFSSPYHGLRIRNAAQPAQDKQAGQARELPEFEAWLRTVCFQAPTPEAYDLAKCAWQAAPSVAVVAEAKVAARCSGGSAGDQGAPNGSWLWVKLMDWCKKRNVSPANYNDLFAIAGEAHQANAAASAQQEQNRRDGVIELDEDEVKRLHSYLADCDRPVSLIVANGFRGYGLYAFDTEYPDEAGEFIAALTAKQDGGKACQACDGSGRDMAEPMLACPACASRPTPTDAGQREGGE